MSNKILTITAIGFFLIALVGCTDNGHGHDQNGGHETTKHETLK